MHIVYIASNLGSEDRLDFEKELTGIQVALECAGRVDDIQLRVYQQLTIDQLPGILRPPIDILQVSAHGDQDSILLAGTEGDECALPAAELVALLNAAQIKPRLILVNACTSNEIADKLSSCADFVIGTTAEVSDRGAMVMAATLFSNLAQGATVDRAFAGARAMLRVIDRNSCDATLWPYNGDATRVVLLPKLRIVAAFPELDRELKRAAPLPSKTVRNGEVTFEFGVADAPDDVTQLVFFTDDPSFIEDRSDTAVEELLSWILREPPAEGQLWISDPPASMYGDCRWYAVVTTGRGRMLTAVSSATEALRRYYFDEAWMGELPPSYAEEVMRAITFLKEAVTKGRKK